MVLELARPQALQGVRSLSRRKTVLVTLWAKAR